MRFLKYPLAAAFLLVSHVLFASEQLPLAVHLEVTGLTSAVAPRVVGNFVLFTFSPRHRARFVGIAFAREDFRTVHSFYRNQHGVFFYLYPIPLKDPAVVYRLIVDGLWRSDPKNPDTLTDPSGIVLSKFVIPARHVAITTSPVVEPGGGVRFYFKAPKGRIVTIAGDFNNWDPFMNQLTRLPDGYYTTSLRLPPGTHAYYYIANGTPFADPLNPRIDYEPDGTKVSVFTLP